MRKSGRSWAGVCAHRPKGFLAEEWLAASIIPFEYRKLVADRFCTTIEREEGSRGEENLSPDTGIRGMKLLLKRRIIETGNGFSV